MSSNYGHPSGRATTSLAFLAIAALAALLLAGPRDWTDGIRTLYAVIGAVIALGAVLVLASRVGKKLDHEQTEKHQAWIAGLSILGLGVAVVALALPSGKDSEEQEPAAAVAADAGADESDAGQDAKPAPDPHADKSAPAASEPGLDESIARAGLALSRGEVQAAEDGFRRAVELAAEQDNDARLLTARMGLAESLLSARKTDEALELIEKTRTWAADAFDTPPADLVRLMVLEGTARTRARDIDAAIPVIEQAVQITDRHYPDDLELRSGAIGALLDAQMAAKNPEKALAAVETHLRKVRAQPGAKPAEIGAWLDSAGRVLGAMGRYDESLARLKESIALIDDGGKGDPVQVALVRTDLALTQWLSGKKPLARKTLAQAREVIDDKLPEDHPARSRAAAMAADFEQPAP